MTCLASRPPGPRSRDLLRRVRPALKAWRDSLLERRKLLRAGPGGPFPRREQPGQQVAVRPPGLPFVFVQVLALRGRPTLRPK